jgi:hypothetical protein
LMLLEQQNKKRLLMARAEQESMQPHIWDPLNERPLPANTASSASLFPVSKGRSPSTIEHTTISGGHAAQLGGEGRNAARPTQASTSPASLGAMLFSIADDINNGSHTCFAEECVGLGSFGTNDLIIHLTVVHGLDEHSAINYAQGLHTGNHALADYQMQLMMLDKKHKERKPTTLPPRETGPHDKSLTRPERENLLLAQQDVGRLFDASSSRDLVNERLHAADTARFSAPGPSSVSRERSPFKQGSPLVPRQGYTRSTQQQNENMAPTAPAENAQTMHPDQTMHREVTNDNKGLIDEMYKPQANAMYAGIDTPKANDETMRKNWLEDGKRLPGIQSIVQGLRELPSERSLERAALESSSNSYDERLLTRMGGPPVSQGSGQQRQADLDWKASEDAKAKHSRQVSRQQIPYVDQSRNPQDLPGRSERPEWSSYQDLNDPDWDDLMNLGNYEDMPGEEVDRLFGRVRCRIKHCS